MRRQALGNFLATIVALALLSSVTGCGPFGSDNDGELTKDEFLARGDEICREGRERFVELQREPPRTPEQAAELTRRLIGISESEVAEIRALNAPEELREPLDRYLRAREEGIAILREGQEAAERQDAQAYARAQAEIAEGQVERSELAQRVGFTECSRPLTAAGGEVPGGP